MKTRFLFAIISLVFYYLGYVVAYGEVAMECEKLNTFNVGSTTFDCRLKQ